MLMMKDEILPSDVIALVEDECKGLEFGLVRLEIFLRDGHPRWNITRSQSIQKGSNTDCSVSEEAA